MNNKTILITGGTGLLGTQFVTHFLRNKYITIFTSKNIKKSRKLISNLKKMNGNNLLHSIIVNHEDKDSSSRILEYLSKHNLKPDCLVNNVINLKYQFIDPKSHLINRKNWIGEFTLDVIVPYELTFKLAFLKKSSLKRVVNIASMYGVVARHPNLYLNPERESPINYGVAKASLIHLTKELAIRLAHFKINVNCISYGGIEGRVDDSFKKRYAKLCPSGKMLKKEDIVGAVDFLTSDSSSAITGHNLIVDGGWTIW